jgi:hypothetical protein
VSRLAAAGAAAIVAIGLVSVPAPAQSAISRPVHVSAIQLQNKAVDLTRSVLPTTTTITAKAAPHADASLPPLPPVVTTALITAALIALTPAWYVAFPITVPASLVIATVAYSALSLIGFSPTPPSAPAWIITWGLAGWAIGPLVAVGAAINYLAGELKPAAAANASRLADSSSASQARRQDHHAQRGLAGSRRTAGAGTNVDPKPTAHRVTKSTPGSSTEKRTGTAGSGRSVTNKH